MRSPLIVSRRWLPGRTACSRSRSVPGPHSTRRDRATAGSTWRDRCHRRPCFTAHPPSDGSPWDAGCARCGEPPRRLPRSASTSWPSLKSTSSAVPLPASAERPRAVHRALSPASWAPVRTFLYFVASIVGGAGNNFGALLGAELVLGPFEEAVRYLPAFGYTALIRCIQNSHAADRRAILSFLWWRPAGLVTERPAGAGRGDLSAPAPAPPPANREACDGRHSANVAWHAPRRIALLRVGRPAWPSPGCAGGGRE